MKKYMIFLILLLIIPINCFALNDTSRSSIVMDVDSGRILYQNNAKEKRLIASITKIMTFAVAEENINVSKKVIAGDEILNMYGTSIYIEKDEEMTVRNLLYGLMLRSGNDASMVIAKAVSKNEENFVKLMNEKAKKLEMNSTIFKNPHGLDEKTKNYSTAYDMAILSRYIYNKSKLYREVINTYKHTLKTNKKSYIWYNRNKLLKDYKYCIGGKTGYTPSAGKTLVSVAKKNNMTLTAVTLKDSDHYENQENLYEYIFSKYKRYKLLDKNHFRIDEEYYKDKLYIKEDFYYPLTKDELENIKTVVKITKLKNYKNNDIVGEIDIKLNDKVIKKVNVYVKKEEKKSLFQKIFKN